MSYQPMADQKYFEDFQIGERFAAPSRTLTDAHFLFFAGLTGDNHPIHYDDEYARERTQFGRRLAHGLLLASLTALGASALAPHVHESMIAFLEQRSRFLAPAFIGDTMYPALEVTELLPKDRRGILKLRATITNQRGETVLEGEHVYLIRRRPDGAPSA
jgi:acyl dehydratase